MKQKQTSRTIAPLQRPVLLAEANQREDSPDDIPSSLVGKYYSVRVTDKVKSAQAIGSVQIDIEEKAILHCNLGRILFAFSFFFSGARRTTDELGKRPGPFSNSTISSHPI
jgi:hypothetical protein